MIDTGRVGRGPASYPTDTPYPSTLSFAMLAAFPLHVLWATHPTTRQIIVITTYVPDDRWTTDFRTRKDPV